MRPYTLAEVAEAVGVPAPDAPGTVTGVVADSREARPGDLFVGIPGDRVDGHDFIAEAAASGAAAALSTRPHPALPTIVDPDPVTALGRLARAVLRDLPGLTTVAITGSSGKTTTKDLLATVAAIRGPVVAPVGSFNTEVGLPLTALRANPDTRTLVLEMGARGAGHIAYLCSIAPPDVAVVLNVGTAHLGEFGSRAAIAAAKQELPAALSPDGIAVLNGDDPVVAAMAGATPGRVVLYGTDPDHDVRISGLSLDEYARPTFDVTAGGVTQHVRLAIAGEHNAGNATAVLAAARSLAIPLDEAARVLATAEPPSRWRMEVRTSDAGVVVVNDAYNANPESMAAALQSLAEMGRRQEARTWAVVGEMRELGDVATEAHDRIGRLAVRLHIDRLIAVGEGARAIHLGAAHEGSWDGESAWVPTREDAVAILRDQAAPGDVVLVKASRAVGMETVAEALLEARA